MDFTKDFNPTYPPPEPSEELQTCHPKDLVHIEASVPLDRPNLPSPPRTSLLDPWFTLSTHLVPCASPRTTPNIPLPQLPKWSPNKDEFKTSAKRTTQEILDVKEKQWRGDLDHLPHGRKSMWNCVNRYVRKPGAGSGNLANGLTLFFAHANGFPKEIWEPALQRLVSSYETQARYSVSEIWLWEARNHGDAALVNADQLDGIFDWRDNSRDILNFLCHYLPPSASPNPLPTHLPRLPDVEAELRLAKGLQGRNVIYIGHSFGGCSTVRAAIQHPELFKHMILVDAMILPAQHTGTIGTVPTSNFVLGAVQRRDGWSSREEALRQFGATPFFKAWDPSVLRIYVECGLHTTADGQVRLKMPGMQEAVCFAENYAPFECFELLPTLDARVELRWLVAGKLSQPEHDARRRLVWRRPANSSHVRMFSAGHLITQEDPDGLAREIHEFLNSRYGTPRASL